MRIVGGELRGRSLASPKSQAIRPTTDRTRESLFNILSHNYPEALAATRVLDLFAGTGALGLEALSRGARSALFVEQGIEGRGLIRTSLDALGLQGRGKILHRDATRLGKAGTVGPFDLVFADPPYGRGLGERALVAAADDGWLAGGALVLIEERADVALELPENFSLLEMRRFGDTCIRFYRYSDKKPIYPAGPQTIATEDRA